MATYPAYFGDLDVRELTGDELTRVLDSLRDSDEDSLSENEVVVGVCLCEQVAVTPPSASVYPTEIADLVSQISLTPVHTFVILNGTEKDAYELLLQHGHRHVGYFAIGTGDFAMISLEAVMSEIRPSPMMSGFGL